MTRVARQWRVVGHSLERKGRRIGRDLAAKSGPVVDGITTRRTDGGPMRPTTVTDRGETDQLAEEVLQAVLEEVTAPLHRVLLDRRMTRERACPHPGMKEDDTLSSGRIAKRPHTASRPVGGPEKAQVACAAVAARAGSCPRPRPAGAA